MLSVTEGRQLLLACLTRYACKPVAEKELCVKVLEDAFKEQKMPVEFAIAYNVSQDMAEDMSLKMFHSWAGIKQSETPDEESSVDDLYSYISYCVERDVDASNVISELSSIPNMPKSWIDEAKEAINTANPKLIESFITKLDILTWINER